VATEQAFPQWRAFGAIYRGWVKAKNGDVVEGISVLRSGAAAYRANGSELLMPHHAALLARACDIAGQIEEAVTQLDDAFQVVERTGERWLDAELNRHKGRLLLVHRGARLDGRRHCQGGKPEGPNTMPTESRCCSEPVFSPRHL